MAKKYFSSLKLRGNDYEITSAREPGERVRKIGIISIDRQCFKKNAKEKEVLKLAKLQCKIDEMKR